MQSRLAIVILNHNGAGFLAQFLPSVLAHSKNCRIIVADNASTDHSLTLLEEQFPEVERIRLESNSGFAGGYNHALKQVDAAYYVLLNSDVEVTEGWLEPMLSLLENNPQIAACQPKIRSYHLPTHFEYAGAAGGFIDWLGYPFCRGRIFDTLEEDLGQYDIARPVFWATGACMLIRSEVFWQMGGFDEDFFAHMEEIDLCWRINSWGLEVWACPQSIVYHVGGGTLPKKNSKKTYLNFRNGLWMLIKNCENYLFIKLPFRILLDWLAALHFLSKGETGNAKAVVKSHMHTIKSVEILYRKRLKSKIFRRSVIPIYKKLILADYFLFKRKYFSKLSARL
jgi:GT2 family glycosyltransferase